MFSGNELAEFAAKGLLFGFLIAVGIGFVLGVIAVLVYGCF